MAGEPRVWAATHTGKVRPINEDRCVVGNWFGGGASSEWRGSLDPARPWVLVADGMGGHEAGEVASQVALETIVAEIPRVGSGLDVVALLDLANLRVFEAMYGKGGRPAMGTTVVGIVLLDTEILVFNVGDSRAYRLADGVLSQLSRDHSLGISSGGRRSSILTHSLGGTMSRRPLEPAWSLVARAGISTLVLCSDGLTDLIPDDEIAAILRRNPDDPASSLVGAALDAGGDDNITVVVVDLSVEGRQRA